MPLAKRLLAITIPQSSRQPFNTSEQKEHYLVPLDVLREGPFIDSSNLSKDFLRLFLLSST